MEKSIMDAPFAVLTELHQEGKLCDAVIKVGNVEFDAHKVILCSCSMYFRTLFTGIWAEPEKQVYTIPNVSAEVMRLIINYSYSHSILINEDNVLDVLAAADQFMIPGIVQACCAYLEDQLCLMNCVGIWRLVDFYYCPELQHKAFLYILHHFEDVVSVSEEFLDLSWQQLTVLLESDHLIVKQESVVFEAVMQWINHMPEQRKDFFSVLLSKMRLGLMTSEYLQNTVWNNELVKKDMKCVSIVVEGMTAYFDRSRSGHTKSFYTSPYNRPRLPPAILLVTGGKDNTSAVSDLEVYDSRANCWVTIGAKVARSQHGAAVLHGFVYLVGGCNGEINLNTVHRFNPMTSTWEEVAPMNLARSFVSIAVLNGCIYAMGGSNGYFYYNSVECYNPETNRWTMKSSMHTKRWRAGATALNGKIYICGGFDGHGSVSTAECYDPDTNRWTMITSMRIRRLGLGVIGYKGYVYAVGGTSDGSLYLNIAEAYNPRTNRWTGVPSMLAPRGYFGIEVVDDQLFVVGGYNGVTSMSSVERYNEETGMWYRAPKMGVLRSGLKCCLVHGVHNLTERLFPRASLKLPSVQKTVSSATKSCSDTCETREIIVKT